MITLPEAAQEVADSLQGMAQRHMAERDLPPAKRMEPIEIARYLGSQIAKLQFALSVHQSCGEMPVLRVVGDDDAG